MIKLLKYLKEYLIIKRSRFFDPAYYLINNPDVRKADIDPLTHYIKYGWKEGRNPSANFNSNYYLELYEDVNVSGMNPLFHFIQFGEREGRNSNDLTTRYYEFNSKDIKPKSKEWVPNAKKFKIQSKFTDIVKRIYHWLPLNQSIKNKIHIYRINLSTQLKSIISGNKYKNLDIYNNFRLPWRREAIEKFLVYINDLISDNVNIDNIITLPFFSTGGAELVALSFARALTLNKNDHVLIITDSNNYEYPPHLENSVIKISVDDFVLSNNQLEKKIFLFDLIITIRPKLIHNINSDLMWNLIIERGNILNQITNVFANIFAFQFNEDGTRLGFAEYYLRDAIPYLNGLLSDNERFISDVVQEYDLHSYASKLRTIYSPSRALNNYNLEIAKARLSNYEDRIRKSNKISCVWAGRIDEEKRYDLFLKLVESCSFAEFTMFGKNVVDNATKLPSFRNLIYKGVFKSTEEIFLMNTYDVFIFTSKWEGLPNVLIEAGTYGVPIIAPDVGGVNELINDKTGYLLPQIPSVIDYLNALYRIIENPLEAVRRAENLLELIISRHSWEYFVNEVKNIPDYY